MKKVYDQIVSRFWTPSPSPIKPEKRFLDQMEQLVFKYESLKKSTKNRLTIPSSQEKIKDFVDRQQSLFDISHSNAYNLLQQSGYKEWFIDWEFLLNQRKCPQVGCMNSVDLILANKQKRKRQLAADKEKRRQKELKQLSNTSQISIKAVSSCEEEGSSQESQESSFIEEMETEARSSSSTNIFTRKRHHHCYCVYLNFSHLINSEFVVLDYDDQHRFAVEQAKEVRDWIKKCLDKNVFELNDYKKRCQLIAIYLGAGIPHGFSFQISGADHHARFMSKTIYYIKLFLLQKLFPLWGAEMRKVK